MLGDDVITDYPGTQYLPSNSSDGYGFLESWCHHCARDKAMLEGADYDECDDNELCPIIAASFRGQAVEWRELESGEKLCVKFVPAKQPIPVRCTLTNDMFGETT
jgi:hypothetical protein